MFNKTNWHLIDNPPKTGKFLVRCRERSLKAATASGHEKIFPQAEMEIRNGLAYFHVDGKCVWTSDVAYAVWHLLVEEMPLPEERRDAIVD